MEISVLFLFICLNFSAYSNVVFDPSGTMGSTSFYQEYDNQNDMSMYDDREGEMIIEEVDDVDEYGHSKTSPLVGYPDKAIQASVKNISSAFLAAFNVIQQQYQNSSTRNVDGDFSFPNASAYFRLLRRSGYDHRIRPNYFVKPVVVTCSLYISSISRISEAQMDYTTEFYFIQKWTDKRLAWNLKHRDNHKGGESESIIVSGHFLSTIWRPDTFFVNEKYSNFHHVTGINAYVKIMPDGHVTQRLRLTVKATCPMHFKYFPIDHQRCPLYIESFSWPINDLEYKWYKRDKTNNNDSVNADAVEFSHEASSLLNFGIHGYRAIDTWELRSDGYNHSRLHFDIYLERNLGYYLLQIYVPAFLIVVISWIAFWLPRRSSPARITLGVTTVLTIVTLSNMGFKAGLPNISYLKAMDIYLLFSFLMVFLALLEYALVSYTEKKARTGAVTTLIRLQRGNLVGPIDAMKTNSWQCFVSINVPSRIEWTSRLIFPGVFFAFNYVYWDFFLNNHIDDVENDIGFVDFDL